MVLSFMPAACGKKGPPSWSVREVPVRVAPLNVVQEPDGLYLRGLVTGAEGPDAFDIMGCRIFRAFYSLNDPPCEGCPKDYRFLKEIQGDWVPGRNFSCRVSASPEPGIHFFRVRLLVKTGGLGPFSDAAEISLE